MSPAKTCSEQTMGRARLPYLRGRPPDLSSMRGKNEAPRFHHRPCRHPTYLGPPRAESSIKSSSITFRTHRPLSPHSNALFTCVSNPRKQTRSDQVLPLVAPEPGQFTPERAHRDVQRDSRPPQSRHGAQDRRYNYLSVDSLQASSSLAEAERRRKREQMPSQNVTANLRRRPTTPSRSSSLRSSSKTSIIRRPAPPT
jgi:hypothetical protein